MVLLLLYIMDRWFCIIFLTGHETCTEPVCLMKKKRTRSFDDSTYQVTCSEHSDLMEGHLSSTTEKILDVGDFRLLSALAWRQESEETWQPRVFPIAVLL
jgi:hypothetical protein